MSSEDIKNYDKKIQKIGDIADLSRFKVAKPDKERGSTYNLQIDTMHYRVFVGLADYFNLKISETNVISVIYSLQKKTGWCYASQATIAKGARISVQALNPVLKKLKKMELLEKGERGMSGVIKWRLGAKALDRMKYVEKMIERVKLENKKNRVRH